MRASGIVSWLAVASAATWAPGAGANPYVGEPRSAADEAGARWAWILVVGVLAGAVLVAVGARARRRAARRHGGAWSVPRRGGSRRP